MVSFYLGLGFLLYYFNQTKLLQRILGGVVVRAGDCGPSAPGLNPVCIYEISSSFKIEETCTLTTFVEPRNLEISCKCKWKGRGRFEIWRQALTFLLRDIVGVTDTTWLHSVTVVVSMETANTKRVEEIENWVLTSREVTRYWKRMKGSLPRRRS